MTGENEAVWATAYGPPDVLEVRSSPDPTPAPDEVLIAVRASGVNFGDVERRRRAYPGGKPPPYVPGIEAGGEILELGSTAARRFKVGQRVVAFTRQGSYRAVTVADHRQTYVVPSGVDLDAASAVLVNGVTARQLLVRLGGLRPTDAIAITAAAGGVGQMVLRMASRVTRGPIIALVGSDAKSQAARGAGASHVLTYDEPDLAAKLLGINQGAGLDLILDSVGGDVTSRLMRSLGEAGRLVIFGRSAGRPSHLDVDELFGSNRSILTYSGAAWRSGHPRATEADVRALFGLLEVKAVDAPIAARLPLSEAPRAHRLLEGRAVPGKILLVPSNQDP